MLTRNFEAFARKTPHLARRPDIRFHIGDVRDFEFPPGHFSHVIHGALGSNAKLNVENPALMEDTIKAGTARALLFAAQCDAREFLLTSTA